MYIYIYIYFYTLKKLPQTPKPKAVLPKGHEAGHPLPQGRKEAAIRALLRGLLGTSCAQEEGFRVLGLGFRV